MKHINLIPKHLIEQAKALVDDDKDKQYVCGWGLGEDGNIHQILTNKRMSANIAVGPILDIAALEAARKTLSGTFDEKGKPHTPKHFTP